MTDHQERRILDIFRAEFAQNATDLAAFDEAVAGQRFTGSAEAVAWCRAWWEGRLQSRALNHGERRLRGRQGRN